MRNNKLTKATIDSCFANQSASPIWYFMVHDRQGALQIVKIAKEHAHSWLVSHYAAISAERGLPYLVRQNFIAERICFR